MVRESRIYQFCGSEGNPVQNSRARRRRAAAPLQPAAHPARGSAGCRRRTSFGAPRLTPARSTSFEALTGRRLKCHKKKKSVFSSFRKKDISEEEENVLFYGFFFSQQQRW